MRGKTPFFTAPHHARWCFLTAIMFVVAGLSLLSGDAEASKLFLGLHCIIAVNATSELNFGRIRQSDVYTVDCIWFNLLMAELHGLALLMLQLSKSPVAL